MPIRVSKAAAVPSEHELVEIAARMRPARPVEGAERPALEIGEHAVGPCQHDMDGPLADDLRIAVAVRQAGGDRSVAAEADPPGFPRRAELVNVRRARRSTGRRPRPWSTPAGVRGRRMGGAVRRGRPLRDRGDVPRELSPASRAPETLTGKTATAGRSPCPASAPPPGSSPLNTRQSYRLPWPDPHKIQGREPGPGRIVETDDAPASVSGGCHHAGRDGRRRRARPFRGFRRRDGRDRSQAGLHGSFRSASSACVSLARVRASMRERKRSNSGPSRLRRRQTLGVGLEGRLARATPIPVRAKSPVPNRDTPLGPGTQPATLPSGGGRPNACMRRERIHHATEPLPTRVRLDASALHRIRLRYAYGNTMSPWRLDTARSGKCFIDR